MTTRLAIAVQGRYYATVKRDPSGESGPRAYLFDDLFTRKYDETILDGLPQRPLDWALPAWSRMAAELERRRDEYDVVVTWSERIALALMTLQHLSPGGKPHVAMLYWFSRPAVRYPMKAFGKSLHATITWSSAQRDYAIRELGLAPEKLYLVKHYVDELAWRPFEAEEDMICSVGSEMRDYPTLVAALRGSGLRCHLATDHMRVDDRLGFGRRVSTEPLSSRMDEGVTMGRKPFRELRDLYARSRFVVVPLRSSDTDNGVTVILEAMAMGKPVICSRTRGQVDVIQEGVTGLFVPVGDPDALRRAMRELWNDPDRAHEMGRAARAYVEKHHAIEKFCTNVRAAVHASLEGRGAERDGSFDVRPATAPQPSP